MRDARRGPEIPALNLRGPLWWGVGALAVAVAIVVGGGALISVDRGVHVAATLIPGRPVATVTHPSGGTVSVLHVGERDAVKQGDLLVSLDTTDIDAQLAQLRVRAEEARRQLSAADAEVRTALDEVTESTPAEAVRIDRVKAHLATVQKDVAGLEARIAVAAQQLTATEIRATEAGRIVALPVKVGDVVSAGREIARIAPVAEPVALEARLSSALATSVIVGQRCRVWLTGLRFREPVPVEGRVVAAADRAEGPSAGPPDHQIRIELDTERTDLEDRFALKAGQRIDVLVMTGARSLIAQLVAPIRRNLDPRFKI